MPKSPKSDPVAVFTVALFRAIGGFFKAVFRGIRSLKRPGVFIGFALMGAVTVVSVRNQSRILGLDELFGLTLPLPARYALYWLTLLLPLLYLAIIGEMGNAKAKKYFKLFEEIGFKGKNGKFPYFLKREKDGYKEILYFKSTLPAAEWKKAIDRLETAFDCSIRRIEQHEKSKKTVKLVTVSTDYQIPKMIRWKDEYIDHGDGVMVIGQGDLDIIKFDLNRTPHVLAAGETGSGKSVILRCMLWQMINKGGRLYMIDFKGGVEFGKAYEQYGEVVTERERALVVLQMLVNENEKRLKLFRELEVKNLKEYNRKTGSNLCRIGVFCDEIAEMLDKKGVSKSERDVYDRLEGALSTLARLSRATGINLFLGVQRPDANVLTGQIKNNVPVRISGRFADKSASEIVLGNTAACDLPDIKGRFIYKMGNEIIEFQSYYFDDEKDLLDIEELDIEPGDLLTEEKQTIKKPEKRSQEPQENPHTYQTPPKASCKPVNNENEEELDLDFD
jgi:S-DNA-T family DNA segregation ATPase FtsK/SpoIIIE